MSWEKKTLGEIINLQRGYDLTHAERTEGIFPVISSSGITDYHSDYKEVGPGVVTGRYGTLGQVYYVEGNYWPHNTTLFVENFKGNHPRFIYYLLQTLGLDNNNDAGAVPGVNRQSLHAIETCLPPLPLQRRIAAVLGRYDALLENYQQQVAALESMAQEVYQEWFVRGRGPGVVVDASGELPEGWQSGKLRDVLAFYVGGGWGQEEPDNDHVVGGHVVRGTDIPNLKRGQVNLDVYRYHKTSNMTSRELRAGDIVFEVSGGSKDQGLGRNVLITDEALAQFGNKVMPASFCKLIRPNQEKISPYYLQQLLDHLLDTQEMAQFEVQSTGISNFQFEDFIDYQPVIIPTMEAMNSFDKLVGPMYKKIGILSTQMATLRTTRDALLPRLLSGQLAVAEAEAA
jgi:type I restriction enzyme S subunit